MAIVDTEQVPLESGDRLTREEFHRRYDCRPDIHRAELVGGVVYVPSPMCYTQHDEANTLVSGWLFTYRRHAPSVRQGSGGTIARRPDGLPESRESEGIVAPPPTSDSLRP